MNKLVMVLVLVAPAPAVAAVTFPADGAYVPLRCHNDVMTDGYRDDAPNLDDRDVIGTPSAPAALRAADDTNLYLRVRLDVDPRTGQTLAPHAWGMAYDLDGDRRTYELLILVDGIGAASGTVSVFTNHTTTTPDDPTDPADLPAVTTYPFAQNARTVTAGTTTGGNADAFLDVAVPWSALAPLGLSRDTATYVWVASSNAADRLNGDFACFDEGTGTVTLSGAASDPTTGDPNGGGGGGGGEKLEGGGGCAATSGSGIGLALLSLLSLRRRRTR
jgi:hypothetical protein